MGERAHPPRKGDAMTWFLIAGAVVAVLMWNLSRRLASDRLRVFTDRRRPSSRLVSNGEFVDGNRHVPVALALTESSFYYENPDVEASIAIFRRSTKSSTPTNWPRGRRSPAAKFCGCAATARRSSSCCPPMPLGSGSSCCRRTERMSSPLRCWPVLRQRWPEPGVMGLNGSARS